MDRHPIDVACAEKSNKSQFTGYINRNSDTNYMKSEWIQETKAQDEASPSGARATRIPILHSDLEEGRQKIVSV